MKHKNVSIGFIGIGVMGKSMVRHLMQDGHTVYVYNKNKIENRLFSARWCKLV
ncbi:NAD(P)-binding domain-containing protein [Bacillus pacificus]